MGWWSSTSSLAVVWQIVLLLQVLSTQLVLIEANTEKDFTQQCNRCRCSWKNGKRNADCTSLGMPLVPSDLSSELQVLDLSNNRIAEIRAYELMNARQQNLHKLYIKNSTLESLHRDAFRNLTILIELDLSVNKLERLDPGLFNDLKKIRVIMLNQNQLERIENNLFENLPFLMKIELKENRIHQVAQHSFINVPKLSQIELDFNELVLLRRETFASLLNLTSLSLTNNPWNCTCALRNFSEFVLSRSLYRSPTVCAHPTELAGRDWNDMHLDDFACGPVIVENRLTEQNGGENITFICRVTGSPLPKVEWLFQKRPLSKHDRRLSVSNAVRTSENDLNEMLVSELSIVRVKPSDRGVYVCKASNKGGTAENARHLDTSTDPAKPPVTSTNEVLLMILFIVIACLLILLLVVVIICCVFRRSRKFKKNSSISENGLMSSSKADKSTDASILAINGYVR